MRGWENGSGDRVTDKQHKVGPHHESRNLGKEEAPCFYHSCEITSALNLRDEEEDTRVDEPMSTKVDERLSKNRVEEMTVGHK